MTAISNKAVVIIDDEKSYTELLAQLLQDTLSCPILTFLNPLKALEALEKTEVALVVTDYYMPHLNGLEFIVRAKAVRPDLPFILITGNLDTLALEGLERIPSIKAILGKPFGARRLTEEIVKHWPAGEVSPLRADSPSV